MMAEKKCTKCGEVKPATTEYFHRHSEGKGGLRPDCKVCFAARMRAYAERNAQSIKEWRKAFRVKNRQALIERDREYYRANKPRLIAQMKEYNARNREAYNERLRRWRKNNPTKVQVWVRNRRAKLKGLIGSHSLQDILALMESQRGKCVYCHCDIRKKFQVDHIVPVSAGGANDKSNLQLLCKKCNLDKHAKDPLDFQKERGMLL